VDGGLGFLVDAGIIVDADTEAEQGFGGVDVVKELVFLVLLLIYGLLVFKSEDK
jgi:hypothetical protein